MPQTRRSWGWQAAAGRWRGAGGCGQRPPPPGGAAPGRPPSPAPPRGERGRPRTGPAGAGPRPAAAGAERGAEGCLPRLSSLYFLLLYF